MSEGRGRLDPPAPGQEGDGDMAKYAKYVEPVELGRVRGATNARRVSNAVFNRFQVNATPVAVAGWDTTFEYVVSTTDRVRKADVAIIRAYVEGVVEGLK